LAQNQPAGPEEKLAPFRKVMKSDSDRLFDGPLRHAKLGLRQCLYREQVVAHVARDQDALKTASYLRDIGAVECEGCPLPFAAYRKKCSQCGAFFGAAVEHCQMHPDAAALTLSLPFKWCQEIKRPTLAMYVEDLLVKLPTKYVIAPGFLPDQLRNTPELDTLQRLKRNLAEMTLALDHFKHRLQARAETEMRAPFPIETYSRDVERYMRMNALKIETEIKVAELEIKLGMRPGILPMQVEALTQVNTFAQQNNLNLGSDSSGGSSIREWMRQHPNKIGEAVAALRALEQAVAPGEQTVADIIDVKVAGERKEEGAAEGQELLHRAAGEPGRAGSADRRGQGDAAVHRPAAGGAAKAPARRRKAAGAVRAAPREEGDRPGDG